MKKPNAAPRTVAKLKGTLVRLCQTKDFQRHDLSKLLRITFLRKDATKSS